MGRVKRPEPTKASHKLKKAMEKEMVLLPEQQKKEWRDLNPEHVQFAIDKLQNFTPQCQAAWELARKYDLSYVKAETIVNTVHQTTGYLTPLELRKTIVDSIMYSLSQELVQAELEFQSCKIPSDRAIWKKHKLDIIKTFKSILPDTSMVLVQNNHTINDNSAAVAASINTVNTMKTILDAYGFTSPVTEPEEIIIDQDDNE